jgi:hypothetical protein
MSKLINLLWDIATAPDWISPLVDMYRLQSDEWETKNVITQGQTPNQRAREEGEGWVVGYVDYDTGEMTLHRKVK